MTEIILHAEPGIVMSWEDFQVRKPPFSIALDRYISYASLVKILA